jgi:peroxiredoxin
MQNEPSLRESSFGSSNPDGGASGYSAAEKKTTFYFIPVAILIAAIAIAGGIVYKYKNALAPEASAPKKSQPVIGSEALLFSLKTSRGVEIKLEDLRGQNILLVFWSTSCEYCTLELAELKQFTEKYRGQITVLAVTYKETAQTVKEYEDKEKINFTMLLDPNGEVAENLYRIDGTPSHFFVDKQGKITSIWPAKSDLYNLEHMAKDLLRAP